MQEELVKIKAEINIVESSKQKPVIWKDKRQNSAKCDQTQGGWKGQCQEKESILEMEKWTYLQVKIKITI